MTFYGVTIDYATADSPKASASGIKLCEHYVLTHASIIWESIKKLLLDKLSDFSLENDNIKLIQRELACYSVNSNSKFTVSLPTQSDQRTQREKEEQCSLSSYTTTEAWIDHVFLCPLLIDDLVHLLSMGENWKFEKAEVLSKLEQDMEIIFLSSFVLLKIKEEGHLNSCVSTFEDLASYPRKGVSLFIDGCPFGFSKVRPLFLNSLSKGIVSNVSEGGNTFLTDARCILGCEGAPAYSMDERFGVCGIVLSPFCWFKGEWVGLTFMASLKPLIGYLKELDPCLNHYQMPLVSKISQCKILSKKREELCFSLLQELTLQPETELLESNVVCDSVSLMEKCIVRVMCPSTKEWGSGVVVQANRGLVVTCAHVTELAKDMVVDIVFWNGVRVEGFVIFQANQNMSHWKNRLPKEGFDNWDVSFICLTQRPAFSLPLAKSLPLVGTPVLVGGYPLFKTEELSSPTFVLGNLAKVCRADVPWNSVRCPSKDLKRCDSFPYSMAINKNLVCLKWEPFTLFDHVLPFSLQTTCAVYNGISGGPVVALHPVQGAVIIGIVNSCARDADSEINFPHVNFATPSFFLAEVVDRFNLTDDLSPFELLKRKHLPNHQALELVELKHKL